MNDNIAWEVFRREGSSIFTANVTDPKKMEVETLVGLNL